MKYTVVNNDHKVSRFFNTKKQAKIRCTDPEDKVMTKKECLLKGIFTEPSRKPIHSHIDMSLVGGTYFTDVQPISYAKRKNQQLYIEYCKTKGFLVPVLGTTVK